MLLPGVELAGKCLAVVCRLCLAGVCLSPPSSFSQHPPLVLPLAPPELTKHTFFCLIGGSRNRTCIEVAAYQGLKPDYKRAPIFAALKERLKKEVAGEGWRKYWPQLCNLSYYMSTELPDRYLLLHAA